MKDKRDAIDAILDGGTDVSQLDSMTDIKPETKPAKGAKPKDKKKAEPKEVNWIQSKPVCDDSEAGRMVSAVQGYTVIDGCTCKINQDGALKQLATFAALIRKQITVDDGQAPKTSFVIEGFNRNGNSMGEATVNNADYAKMEWPLRQWGLSANILPGNGVKDQLRYIIQEACHDVPCETWYAHTGWRECGGKLVYLHGGGAIGAEGVKVQLEGRLTTYNMSMGEDVPLEKAIAEDMMILNMFKPELAWSLMGTVYLSPLVEFMQAKGIAPKYSLYLVGATQSGKTTSSLIALSHFGNFNGGEKIPASFLDTGNSVTRSAFVLKDMPILVDDYYPAGNEQEKRRMQAMAQTLARAFGNGGSRGRLSADMTQREALPPRGVSIITGEQEPDIKESGLARFFIVNVKYGDLEKFGNLTELREKAMDGYLVRAMTGYIEWLAKQSEALPQYLYERFKHYRDAAKEAGEGARACESEAWIMLGSEMMLQYWVSVGMMDETIKEAYMELCENALRSAAKEQAKAMAETKPTAQFMEILTELLMSKTNNCLDVNGNDGGVNVIGYMDSEYYYFMPEMTYKAVSKFCSDQGSVFPIGWMALRKQLTEQRIVAEGMENKLKRARGKVGRYMWIPRVLIDGRYEKAYKQMEMAESDEKAPFEEGK